MNAMTKPRDLAPAALPQGPLGERVIDDFIRDGAHLFAEPLDAAAASDLLADIRATRDFGAELFLTEAEFDADPQYTGVNPKPGRNLLEGFEARLAFVEQSPQIVEAVTALLGPDYEILNKKVVCGVPADAVPQWLRQRILTGGTGFAAMWHACTLHGTQPDAADHERISLRYLIAKRHEGLTGMDEVNATLRGPLSLTSTRADLDASGAAVIKANTVNQA